MRWTSLVTVIALHAALASAATAKTANATLVNNTSFAIYEIYLSPSSDRHWGPDQLEEQVLAPGDSLTLRGIPCDRYDVRLVDEDGDECVIQEGYLCGDAGEWYLTDEELLECEGFKAHTASATLVNQTSYDIHALFISPSHESHWGPDQLGNEILQRGYYFTFSGLPCGDYDLRIVDEDSDECVIYGVHLCGAEGEAVLTDEELLDCQGF